MSKCDLGLGNRYLAMTRKALETIDTLDFTKIKIFCASKHAIRKVKCQLREWEKIFAKHISDK